ncbi:hypothetical protein [Rahnella sp. ChDrAdgB13]|uniref:hypothetical protein n=1 Tax=Rahnella sp. ChDrAdgB13 TaxID=1850581 RepID=UPI001AD887E6|nr:hypothetical protein [Rahnella sp. ChDrAdgB13]
MSHPDDAIVSIKDCNGKDILNYSVYRDNWYGLLPEVAAAKCLRAALKIAEVSEKSAIERVGKTIGIGSYDKHQVTSYTANDIGVLKKSNIISHFEVLVRPGPYASNALKVKRSPTLDNGFLTISLDGGGEISISTSEIKHYLITPIMDGE